MRLNDRALKKLRSGHPWVLASDMSDSKNLPSRAGLLQFGDYWFFYSPQSQFRLRRLGPHLQHFLTAGHKDKFIQDPRVFGQIFSDWLLQHLQKTLEQKIADLQFAPDENYCLRWIFSENDFIPGLIIDVFDDVVVCELLTAPIDLFWPTIKPIVEAAYKIILQKKPQIVEGRLNANRKKEGLELIASETPLTPRLLRWNGLSWWMTPAGQQKTGSYLDQGNNHKLAAQFAQKFEVKTAWDICAFEGGFSLHLAKANIQTLAIDQSAKALLALEKNRVANNIDSAQLSTLESDMFEFLRARPAQRPQPNMIVLDPPSFVRTKTELQSALRGYTELNTLALRHLAVGGLLVSCTCSQAVDQNTYLEVLRRSAQQAERQIDILQVTGPSPDHRPLPEFPEGDYLHAYFVSVR